MIENLYSDYEKREIAKMISTKNIAKSTAIFSYFLRMLLKQKRLVFTRREFWKWCKKFTNTSMRQVDNALKYVKKIGWIRELMRGHYRVELACLIDLGLYELRDLGLLKEE